MSPKLNPTDPLSALTLPGFIPGLLRRGSPIRDRGVPGVYIGADLFSDERTHLVCLGRGLTGSVPLDGLALDLSDATGRAHAAWWLCERWGADELYSPFGLLSWHDAEAGTLTLIMCGAQDVAPASDMDELLALIEDLDPHDPRGFHDGSRWVDVEALRRIVLHVAGVTP